MSFEIRLLGNDDSAVLQQIADGVFDEPINAQWTHEFLNDPRHHLVVALENDIVVGIASAVHYVHPDKAPQLWINEVGVAPTHHRQGIARQLLARILDLGRSLGCTEAWLGTEESNVAARQLYKTHGGVAEQFILYSFPLES